MAHFARTAVAAAAIGLGQFVAVPPLAADELGFYFNSIDPGLLDGSGTFDVVGANIQSVSGTFNTLGVPGTYSVDQVSPGSTFIYEGYINADFTSGAKFANYDFQLTTSFTSGGKFGNQVVGTFTNHGVEEVSTVGFFYTPVISVSEGGSSGNAPSPEVNAFVSLLVVGGTVAFLRRRGRSNNSVSV